MLTLLSRKEKCSQGQSVVPVLNDLTDKFWRAVELQFQTFTNTNSLLSNSAGCCSRGGRQRPVLAPQLFQCKAWCWLQFSGTGINWTVNYS